MQHILEKREPLGKKIKNVVKKKHLRRYGIHL